MPGSGTRTFLDPDHYETSLRRAQLETVITPHGKFQARLTWAELHDLKVVRCEEGFSRVAYVSLAPQLSFVTFPAHLEPLPVWGGTELRPHEIIFHSRGDRLHQSTSRPGVWSVIALNPVQLEYYGRALSGKPFSLPPEASILGPSPRNAARLRRVHAQICRLAETKPRILSHSEVARALEQDLIQALIASLTTTAARAQGVDKRDHASIMISFEEVLAQHLGDCLHMPTLCELIGVTQQALRSSCAEFLGMSPTRYVLLRRLRQARIALRDAEPDAMNIAELAQGFGFEQLARFAAEYQAVFGETPSTTLQRAPGPRFATP
jgi:AraC-like DNA-binding protein